MQGVSSTNSFNRAFRFKTNRRKPNAKSSNFILVFCAIPRLNRLTILTSFRTTRLSIASCITFKLGANSFRISMKPSSSFWYNFRRLLQSIRTRLLFIFGFINLRLRLNPMSRLRTTFNFARFQVFGFDSISCGASFTF